MKLIDLKNKSIAQLQEVYDKAEAEEIFVQLAAHFLAFSKADISFNKDVDVQTIGLEDAVNRLLRNEPLQYIIGEVYFYGLTLKVNKHTLIPRPETEELLSIIQKERLNIPAPKRILDIGTGSGCIALGLKSIFPRAEVYALDISEEALKVAGLNAEKNNLRVECIHADILNESTWPNTTFDLIVSNPPYVREFEKGAMHKNVKDFEPAKALFVSDDNPLIFYKAILKFALSRIVEKGVIYTEINQYLGKETKSLFSNANFHADLYKDMFGNNRFVKAWK